MAMKTVCDILTLSTVALTLAWTGGAAFAQTVAQTPLAQPVQVSGTLTPSRPSVCGYLGTTATQVLEVEDDFMAITVAASGSPGLTLWIEGPNGFSECHRTSDPAGTVNAPGLLNQGRHHVYIGNVNPVPTEYQLTISQN